MILGGSAKCTEKVGLVNINSYILDPYVPMVSSAGFEVCSPASLLTTQR